MTCGIYSLRFGNQSVYVGQSKDIEGRYGDHVSRLKLDKHTDKLMAAYRVSGTPKLRLECICSEDNLNTYENIFIRYYDSYYNGLNSLEKAGDIPKPNNAGTRHGCSKYTEEQILQVVDMLVHVPPVHYSEIEEATGVSYSSIGGIASLNHHRWIKDMYPEKYSLLEKLKHTRNIGRAVNTAADKGKAYPPVKSPSGEIFSSITNVSAFMREHGITSRRFYGVLNGKENKIMGWTRA